MTSNTNVEFRPDWNDPKDAEDTWVYDSMHFPRPAVPLATDLLRDLHLRSLSARVIFVNSYMFMTMPMPAPPSEEILKRGVLDVWLKDYVPQIQKQYNVLRKTDYDSLDLAELGDAAAGIIEDSVEAFTYTMKPITGFMGPTFGLVGFLQGEFGPEGAQMAASLLQGFENGTASAGTGLSDLAEKAIGLPSVAAALRDGKYEGLESVDGGPEFLADFNGYLDEFGWRPNSWGEFHVPTWAENPRLPLMLIGRYISDPKLTPALAIQRSIAQREAAVEELEAKLDPAKLSQFRDMLSAASAHVPMSEGRALWQLLIVGATRIPFLALGRKLAAAGAIDQADDVFFLTTSETKDAAHNPSADWKKTVAERRANFAVAENLSPPPFLGSPPDLSKLPPEIAAGIEPLMHLFFGAGAPDVEGKQIRVQAASKGVVHARARVIRNLGEAERLQNGEVLVCQTTAPPWTPLFSVASAVVTDSGGVLSHSAICAREYAIPCVVATQVATRMIPDGAMVTVDGTAGTVVIEG